MPDPDLSSLTGRRVRLRALASDDVASLLALSGSGFSSAADRAENEARLHQLVAAPTSLAEDGFWSLAVEHQGALVGDIQARAPRHGFPPGVCEVGITLQPQVWGQGLGTEAVQLLTTHLHLSGWPRVQASTAGDNHGMRRVLERSGYHYEGQLRSFAPDADGGRADYVLYASISPG